MFDQKKYIIETLNVNLDRTVLSNDESITIPDGKVVRIGVALKGNTEDRNINVNVLNNGSEVTKPVDYKFLEKTTGGNFLDSFCPVDIDGGKKYEVRLSSPQLSAGDDITAQFIFIIEKQY